MVREASPRGTHRLSSKARSSKDTNAPPQSNVLPTKDRAPGRGKYDRNRSADERHEEQRNRLLDAAGHVFAEMGWADATVEAIVHRAGMSRRTFYEHFDDLRDCLFTFHQKAMLLAFRTVETAIAAPHEPLEMLDMGVRGFLGSIASFPHVARVVLLVARSAGPEFEAAHDEMIGRFVKLAQAGVARAHEEGKTTLPADELRVFTLVAGIEAVAMRYVNRGEESKALEAAPILVDMVSRAFGGPTL